MDGRDNKEFQAELSKFKEDLENGFDLCGDKKENKDCVEFVADQVDISPLSM